MDSPGTQEEGSDLVTLEGFKAHYTRPPPGLFDDLGIAREDGRYAKLMGSIAKAAPLVIDAWGLCVLGVKELFAERMGAKILEEVNHKHYVFSIQKIIRPYSKFNWKFLGKRGVLLLGLHSLR